MQLLTKTNKDLKTKIMVQVHVKFLIFVPINYGSDCLCGFYNHTFIATCDIYMLIAYKNVLSCTFIIWTYKQTKKNI